MQKYQDTVAKPNGDVLSGASILVQSYPGAVTSTIYSDDGVTPATNPLTSDSQGNFSFYAADGRYQLVVSGTGLTTRTVTDVLLEDPTDGIGYDVGFGGAVTQLTSKSTGVTLNKLSGAITLHDAALAGTTSVGFVLTNSYIAATDIVLVNIKSGATANSYVTQVEAVSAGSCQIVLRNYTGGSLGEAVVLSFAVIKGAVA